MPDYVHLIGAEDVSQAARNMRGAADDIQRAASQISEALLAHQRFMDDWLARLDCVLSDRIHDFGQAGR